MRVNINNFATVRLTTAGRGVWDRYWHDLSREAGLNGNPFEPAADGTLRTELWQLMRVFGPELFMGNVQMFQDNAVEIAPSESCGT